MYRIYGNTLQGWEKINQKPTLEETREIVEAVKQDSNYESVMVLGCVDEADTVISRDDCCCDMAHIQLNRKTKKKLRKM